MTQQTRTKVTLFDLDDGELFAFGYAPNETYRLMSIQNSNAIVRAQRAGAEDENANPYYDNIIRK